MAHRVYKRNFLDTVIVRVDFNPALDLANAPPPELAKVIRKEFPAEEQKQGIQQQLTLTRDSFRQHRTQKIDWHFNSRLGDKKTVLSSESLILEYSTYRSFEQLTSDFLPILDTLAQINPTFNTTRVGLRYIDKFHLNHGKDLFDWSPYIQPDLLGTIAFARELGDTSRVLHWIETNSEDMKLRFQFGLLNPDFPAPIRAREFVLDMDAFTEAILTRDEIPPILDCFHERISETFEKVITDELRTQLNRDPE